MNKKEIEKQVKEQNLKEEFKIKDVNVENNLDEEKITFEALISFLKKYVKGEYTKEAYENLLKKLNVKPYLKLEIKAQLLITILIDIKYANNFVSEIATVDCLLIRMLIRSLLIIPL